MFGFDYRMEHICSYNVALRPEVIGPLAGGFRINFHITGGEVDGPRLRGKLRPGGADFFTMRTDGVGEVDVRATIQTHDGALIYAAYTGLAYGDETGYAKLVARERSPANRAIPLRLAPRFSSAHPEYVWINRLQCVGIGDYSAATQEVRLDIYALR